LHLCDTWYLSLCVDDCVVGIPVSQPHRVTNTKCRINTVISPDDGHIVARNMQRKEINILRKLCTKLALFTRLYKDAPSIKHKILCLHNPAEKCARRRVIDSPRYGYNSAVSLSFYPPPPPSRNIKIFQ